MPKIGQTSTSKDASTPLYEIYTGDCIHIFPHIEDRSIHLIFADPPFNINWNYDVYKDNRPKEDYLRWTKQWLEQCRRVIHPQGTIYVAIGLSLQAEVKLLMDSVGFYWRDTICWHYTFGSSQTTKLTPSWTAIHQFTASPPVKSGPVPWTWNADAIRVPSARQVVYRDSRAVGEGKMPNNVWVPRPVQEEWNLFPVATSQSVSSRAGHTDGTFSQESNCWMENRVCGTFRERTEHPCQMPMVLLDRIIKVSSNEGDLVLDPFAGSGTTLEAALKTNRRSIGIEVSRDYVEKIIKPRLEKVNLSVRRSST